MHRENKQPWIITERHQQSDLRVHLIANEMGGRGREECSQAKRRVWVGYGFVGFLLVAGIYLSPCLLPYSWHCEKLASYIPSYTSHFVLSPFSLT